MNEVLSLQMLVPDLGALPSCGSWVSCPSNVSCRSNNSGGGGFSPLVANQAAIVAR